MSDDRPLLDIDPTLLDDARATVALALWISSGRLARTSALEDAMGIACLGDAVEGLGAPGAPCRQWPGAELQGPIREAARRVIEEAAQHTDEDAAVAEWWDDQSARAERLMAALSLCADEH